jgi:excinuclease ABC subunit C
MKKDDTSLKKLPDSPGVYFFIGEKDEILYIGKATSLKDRVKSYFSSGLKKARGAHICEMVNLARKVDFTKTDSVLEALILEASLIKQFSPKYNTKEKDDKSFMHLIVTVHEKFPRLLSVRGKDLDREYNNLCATAESSKKEPIVYGPFPHALQFKEALKIIRKIFPFYDTKKPVEEIKKKKSHELSFNEAIGVFPQRNVSEKEYVKTVRHIKMIFDGKLKKLINSLEKEMKKMAREEEFEKAEIVKRQIFSLKHIEDVSLIKKESENIGRTFRIEAFDVAHLSGENTVGTMVVLTSGVIDKKEYRVFNINNASKGSDVGALEEVLSRRFSHTEWKYPRLVVLDGGVAQMNVAKKVLTEKGLKIPVVSVVKDERHKPKDVLGSLKFKRKYKNEILLANAEAHRFSLAVHKRKRNKELKSQMF